MGGFRRFLRAADGNFATLAAILAVPLVFAVGAGMDASRALSARLGLQDAVDAAALAVVKDSGFVQFEAERIARERVSANFDGAYDGLSVRFTEFGAVVSARTVVATTLTGLLGFSDLDAFVSGTVEYPPTRYEIALVLDTTGSMAGEKLAEMKGAAARMVAALTDSEIMRRRVSFAVVPFSTHVNVGADKAGGPWIDADGLAQVPNSVIPAGVSRLEIFENFGEDWKGCVETRLEAGAETYSFDDAPATRGQPRSLYVPALSPDEPGRQGGRRIYPNDFAADDSVAGLGVTFDRNGRPVYRRGLRVTGDYRFFAGDSTPQGPNWGCDSQPVRALTKDYAAVTRDIAALKAKGSTNITEGVAWGNRVLSPGEPFAQGLPNDADVEKIMVLLTDGDNTITRLDNSQKSAYSAMGYLVDGRWDDSYKGDAAAARYCPWAASLLGLTDLDGDGTLLGLIDVGCPPRVAGRAQGPIPSAAAITAAMDRRTRNACDVAKATAVEIYTIRLEVDSASSSQLLEGCASTPTHYYDAPDASKLQEIFDDIASRIKTLKITS